MSTEVDINTPVRVVPADKIIIVGGEAIIFEEPFDAPENMHALQWYGRGGGHIEWKDDYNWKLLADPQTYDEEVKPFVELWQREKDRQYEQAELARQKELEIYNSVEARFARLRARRDEKIAATDYLIMPDYPLSDDDRAAVRAYRQALRDIPSMEGAPWDGGETETPWPDIPCVSSNI